MPREIEAGRLIDRFGAATVYNRPLGYKELRRIQFAETIVRAYHDRAKSLNWATWASEHPELNDLLNWAMKLNLNDSENRD